MRIAILGAGGVGGYFGGVLARAGHEVVMLARGAHLHALQTRGIEVRTPEGHFIASVAATDNPAALGTAEYTIVAVKNYSLAEIAPAVRGMAAMGSVIVPLLNGVEVVDRLVALGVPADQVLGGLTGISVARLGPGVVERTSPFQRVIVGEVRGGKSQRAERISATLRDAGVEAVATDDISAEIWRKFALIASMAAACGLARSPVGLLRETALGQLLIERAVREAVAVAHARGIALPEDEPQHIVRRINSVPAAMKPSLLLDLEAGGPTEIDDLSGTVSRLGRLAGIDTPVHDTATAALGCPRRPVDM
jgi:2-dehydropantoate 2-reductase